MSVIQSLMSWFYGTRKCRSRKRLDGQVIIVTGSSAGIGKITALELARRGAHVVMACRNINKAEAAAAEIRASVPGADLEIILLDLSSLESVRTFCKEFKSRHKSLHILINNAGLCLDERCLTVDGIEKTFATNYLGHFLLTLLLLPIIVESAPSRIINVSSLAHVWCNSMYFDDLNLEKNFTSWGAYARSKLANILFTEELARRLIGKDVKVVSLHPGNVRTEIATNVKQSIFTIPGILSFIHKKFPIFLLNSEEGAQTSIYCALDDSIESGLYYSDCSPVRVLRRTGDKKMGKELWGKSIELVKLFDFDPFSKIST